MLVEAEKVKSLFTSAVEKLAPDQWNEFLDEQCQGNPNLRNRVQQLLEAHVGNDSLLDARPDAAPPTIDRSCCEQPGTLIGPYKLLEQIGEGGMGLVYMAEQQRPMRRLVALKLIKPGMVSKQVIARFEAEKQALAMMDHENIAKVFEAGTTDTGRFYFAMELVRGIPINEFCDQKRLSVRERLALFIQVCQAVQHAHQKGIIHRDLKPSNVLVTMHDVLAVPKVIDFGIAKALGQQLTDSTLHTGFAQLVGTPLYMSPEQAEMNQLGVDTRSDVYSLGVLLYELLTGTTPFDKETLSKAGLDEMRRMIREDEPDTVSARIAKTRSRVGSAHQSSPSSLAPSPHPLAPRLSELDWIVMKALEKDRSRRYESASAFAADVQRYLSDEPVIACPPTSMYRFQKFARKHKPALATAAAIALCLILGTTVSAWQAARATQAEAQANANEQKAVANEQKAIANEAQAKEAAAAEAQQRQRAEANEQKANTQRDEVKALYEQLKATQAELRSTLYASNMNLARHAWDVNDVERVQELLAQHRPKPGETDLRSFEWHYLYRQSHAEILSLKGGSHSVAYSPDGKSLASADAGGTLKVWNAQTGKQLLALKGGCRAGNFSNCVAFSPDGKRLASATLDDNTVKVWNSQTGQELLSLEGYTGNMGSVAFSPDGKRLATLSWAGKIAFPAGEGTELKVWDLETGKQLRSHMERRLAGSLAFSPDGKQLACGYKVFDAQTGQELLDLKQNEDTRVAFSPDGKCLAGASGHELKVWDAQTGRVLLTLTGPSDAFKNVAYSPDGKNLASASGDSHGTIKVWDAQTGQEVHAIKHGGRINGLAYSPNGRYLVNAGEPMMVWDAQPSQNPLTLKGGDGFVSSVAFGPDGKRLAVGRKGNSAKPWEVEVCDTQSGKVLLTLKDDDKTQYVGNVVYNPNGKRVVYSPDGKRLATDSKTVKVWDAETGQQLLSLEHRANGSSTGSLAFSPDSKRVATCGGGTNGLGPGYVKVWDAQTGREQLTIEDSNHVQSVTFSPDGKCLAGGTGNFSTSQGEVKVWDSQTGRELFSIKGSVPPVHRLAFAPDGKRLASASWERVLIWDFQTGKELLGLTLPDSRGLAFSPDGKRLVLATNDKTVIVFNAQTGQELLSLEGHAHENGVAFSPDGHRFAAGAANSTVKIYDATPLTEKP